MTTTRYLWNPINQNIIREYDGAGNAVASYTTEPDLYGDVVSQHRDGQDSYYHTDGQGSTLALTDSSGDVTDSYAYSAFGEVTKQNGNTVNPLQYIGQTQYYRDAETGEYEIRQRPMTATYSRWFCVDPLFLLLQGPNPYSYVGNNPLLIDPGGLVPLSREVGLVWDGFTKRVGQYPKELWRFFHTMQCGGLADLVESLLGSEKDRRAWRRFVEGTGQDIVLTNDEVGDILSKCPNVVSYLADNLCDVNASDLSQCTSKIRRTYHAQLAIRGNILLAGYRSVWN